MIDTMETTMFFGIMVIAGLLMCWVIHVIAGRIEKLVNTRVGQWLITKLF